MSTLKYLFDEDEDQRILRGLKRRDPSVEVITVQEAGLRTAHDPEILELAASEGYVLVTQDINTMTSHLYERMDQGKTSHGVIFIPHDVGIGDSIEDLILIWSSSTAEEWLNTYDFLPI
ncbi:MAG: DUF5615 family PIN-like protein [Planctomycetota bacterium]|nr:DUF5615 family PIN-like protein [Planctomycetota bacterium]